MPWPCQTNVEPWQAYDPKQRLHYILNRVKGFIGDVATRSASPFLHRHLYKDQAPPCIVSCFSTCVLYQNRNSINIAMVVRALQADIKGLVESESARRAVLTPVEKLARTQALFLYQVIRLLDGDVMLRAQGERDLPLLGGWVDELCKVRENLGNLAQLENGVVRTEPPAEWEVSTLVLKINEISLTVSGGLEMDICGVSATNNHHDAVLLEVLRNHA